MRAEMKLGGAQKSSPEALKSLEIDLRIANLDFHDTIEKHIESLMFQAPKGSCELRFVLKRL